MDTEKKHRYAEVKIDQLSKKGNGLGTIERQQGPVKVEVPFTLPGDTVKARLFQKRSGVYKAKLEEVLTPSPDRIVPRCVHFGVCGGCRLQHMDYSQQLKYKEQLVNSCFEKMLNSELKIRPIVPCDFPWQYRNKMEYTFSSDAAGRKFLGLIMDSSQGKVLNLTECYLTNFWFIDALKAIRQWWHESGLDAYHMPSNKGTLRTLTLREGMRSGDRMVILTVSGNPDFAIQKHQIELFIAYLRDAVEPLDPACHFSIVLRIQQIGKGMATNFYEMILYGTDYVREVLHIKIGDGETNNLVFHISPPAFFQTNTVQAEKLYSIALTMAEISSGSIVYDLYCGTGALGLCIAKQAQQVIGVELSPESVLDARTNAAKNGFSNVTFYAGDVGDILGQVSTKSLPPPDIVMVDPPRPGLDQASIRQLLALNPKKILYVSCNPITQAENVLEFLQNGYQIQSIQPIDQFPQTYHVENIVVLVKK